MRCGIALAGANHASQITNALAEDGILTGLEASLLKLQGTELVILSACDSGTGEVEIGEGVMSLRRAFRIAGAQTVLASHWKASDNATSQLITDSPLEILVLVLLACGRHERDETAPPHCQRNVLESAGAGNQFPVLYDKT